MRAALPFEPHGVFAPALALSLLLHLALFAAAVWIALPSGSPEPIIRVALRGGGGGGGSGGSAAEPPARAAARPEPAPPAAPPAAPVVIKPAAQVVKPKPEQRVAARSVSRPETQPMEKVPAAAPPAASTLASTSGAGDGRRSGHGPGSGSGTGAGAGSGRGVGGAAGAGNDLRARCLRCPEPQYPRIARVRGWEGVVDVEVSITPDGTVDAASVNRSSGYAALDDAALKVARQSRFKLAGVSSGARGRMAYGFRLTTRQP